jgi:hypothetical protein
MAETTAYYRRPDGAIVTRTLEEVDGPIEVSLPAPTGWERIDEATARTVMAEHAAERDRRVAADWAARDATRQRAHEQLVALGLDADLAAFLTGGGP